MKLKTLVTSLALQQIKEEGVVAKQEGISIHLFKIMGMLTPASVRLKRNIIWDIIELDWKEVNMTLNGNKINLLKSVIIKLRDKFKIRCILKREPLLFHSMLKQGLI